MKPLSHDLVTNGRFNFGRFDAPFPAINPLDAQPYRLPLPRLARDFRLKEWQAFQFANDRFFCIVALFNAKVLALVQLKVYDRQNNKKYVFEKQVPPWSFRAPLQLLDSEMRYSKPGCHVRFRNRLAEDEIDVELDIDATEECPAVHARLTAHYEGQSPLVVAIPFDDRRGMYSHKGIVPLEGTLRVGEESTEFGPGNGYMALDDHRGYYSWVMRWDWVTSARYTEDGKLFGFNLTRNDSVDPEQFNENAFWLDGEVHALPPVAFHRRRQGARQIWEVRDKEGRVSVDFCVEVEGHVDINAVVIRSKYQGPFGSFTGHLVDEDGIEHSVDGMFGMAEDFYLRV